MIKSLHQTSCIETQGRYLKAAAVLETLQLESIGSFRSFCEFVWYECLVESVMVPTTLKDSCSGGSSLFSCCAVCIVSP